MRNPASPPRDEAGRQVEEQLRERTEELSRLNARLQQEVVEHSRTSERLRVSERQLRESQRLAGVGSWEVDLRTDALVWSEEMYRIFARPADTFTPTLPTVLACVPPEDHAAIHAMLDEARRTRHNVSCRHRVIRPDGSLRLVQVSCSHFEGQDGAATRISGTVRDVTEEREREEAMEQTLRDLLQLRDMVNRSPAILGIAHGQLENPMVYMSEGIRLFGYAPEEFTSGQRRWIDVVHADDRARVRKECEGQREAFALNYRVLTASGAIRWVCEDITPVRENGRLRLESVLLDVTAAREAEHRLHDLLALNEVLVAAAPVGIAAFDPTGQCVFANPAMGHLVNATTDQVRCQNINHLASWRESGLLALAREALSSGVGRSDTVHVSAAFGREAWLDCSFTPFQRGGQPHLLAVFHDVTERRLMTLSLQESEKRFRQLFESMTEGCTLYELVYDRNGTPVDTQITAINPAGEAIIGKKAAELVGRRASQLIPDRKPLFLEIYGALDRGGPPVSIETRLDFLNKDLFLSFSSPRKGLIAATYTDITARKEAEARMLQYQRQLRHLAAGIAMAGEQERRRIAVELHDGLGQTLALCKLKLESLQCDAKGTPFTRPLGKAVRLLEEAIRETRSLTFQLSPPVLHELGLGAAIDWLAEHLGKRQNIAIRVTRGSWQEPADMAVKVILFQSVRELVFNAIKHAQAGVIAIDIRTARGHLEIAVRDDGKGFEPDAQRGAGRTGMGLFNIQERVQLIGGAMLIKSRPGQGTQATLVAPLEAVAAGGQERRSP